MGVFRKDKVFFRISRKDKEFWGKMPFFGLYFAYFGMVLRKFFNFQGIFEKILPFAGQKSSGRISFQRLGSRKDKDFLLKYRAMVYPGMAEILVSWTGNILTSLLHPHHGTSTLLGQANTSIIHL